MQIVISRTTHRTYKPARGDVPWPSLSLPVGDSVYLIVEFDFTNVYLPRINPQDWAILPMKLFYLENVLPPQNAVVIKLVPVRYMLTAGLPGTTCLVTIM
jgi:hypothetical protein